MSEVRTFMGITIEGDTGYGRYQRDAQEPIEKLYPYIKTALSNGALAISWNQYTPYFNDGEPCEFSVGDVGVTTDPKIRDAWLEGLSGIENEDGSYDYIEHYEYTVPSQAQADKWGLRHPDGLVGDDFDVPANEERFEDALRATFGDHTTIVITPERVVQFEYSHD